ncbi:MAG: hypothetical protein BMS9Abin36_0670 [Gammaproteobacteria bacterium]|nr:MAG: hypothetical protein BMS9Abin36_0670 [Gammaproteobacteria bacterium]
MSIFDKHCPLCKTLLPSNAAHCECGYSFDPATGIEESAQELGLNAQEEQLYENYLAARLAQTEESVKVAQTHLKSDPENQALQGRLAEAEAEAEQARAELTAQSERAHKAESASHAARGALMKAKTAREKRQAKAAETARKRAEQQRLEAERAALAAEVKYAAEEAALKRATAMRLAKQQAKEAARAAAAAEARRRAEAAKAARAAQCRQIELARALAAKADADIQARREQHIKALQQHAELQQQAEQLSAKEQAALVAEEAAAETFALLEAAEQKQLLAIGNSHTVTVTPQAGYPTVKSSPTARKETLSRLAKVVPIKPNIQSQATQAFREDQTRRAAKILEEARAAYVASQPAPSVRKAPAAKHICPHCTADLKPKQAYCGCGYEILPQQNLSIGLSLDAADREFMSKFENVEITKMSS